MSVLLEIKTDAWNLQVVGALPELPSFLFLGKVSKVEVTGAGEAKLFERGSKAANKIASGDLIEPVFFENRNYDFYLTVIDGLAELKLPPAANLHHKIGNVSHYSINFRSDIGFADFIVKSDKSGETRIRVEVFPTKIDYRNDYREMRDEVAEITRSLILAAQARTFGAAAARATPHPTLLEWISLARGYFQKLVLSAGAIAGNPHSKLVKAAEILPINKTKKVDERHLARVLRNRVKRTGAILPGSNIALPDRILGNKVSLTFDTPENRYIKALLLQTKKNLQKIVKTSVTGDEDADQNGEQKFFAAIRPEARKMLSQIQLLINAPYLRAVRAAPPSRPPSMVVQQHPHYSSFERTARLLNGGLAVDSGVLQVGVKDTALLYEYWCFLKLAKILAEKFTLEQQNIARVRHTKTAVTLHKGKQFAVKFRDSSTGKEILLIYNRFFNRLPTIGQKPDNVIQLASENQLYILDAKYRLGFGQDYEKQCGGIGPMTDDIAAMHRYRDAIVLPDPKKTSGFLTGVVRGAVVLFPYSDEIAYANHRFFTSIASVEIGGLPFLPRATELVERKLIKLIEQYLF